MHTVISIKHCIQIRTPIPGAPISRYTIEFITPSRSPIELGGDVRSYLFSLTPDTSFE